MQPDEPMYEKLPPRVQMPNIIPVPAEESVQTPPHFSQMRVDRPAGSLVPKLAAVLLVVAILGTGLYLLGSRSAVPVVSPTASSSTNPTSPAVTSSTNPVPSATPTSSALLPDAVEGWATYTDKEHQLSFRYPATFGAPKVTVVEPSVDGPWWDFAGTSLVFGDYVRSIDLTTYDSYLKSTSADAELKANVGTLQDIFVARGKTNLKPPSKPIWLPPANAAITHYTRPRYIENSAGTFRGVYYFARIGQDDPPEGLNPEGRLEDLVIVLSDGKSRIFQLHIHLPLDYEAPNPNDYQEVECTTRDLTVTCGVHKDVMADFDTIADPLIATIAADNDNAQTE